MFYVPGFDSSIKLGLRRTLVRSVSYSAIGEFTNIECS